jgi:hypothetical protein
MTSAEKNAAKPDQRDTEVAQLKGRIAELEQERGAAGIDPATFLSKTAQEKVAATERDAERCRNLVPPWTHSATGRVTDDSGIPWTKREIIDAMLSEYRPFRAEDMETWAFYTQIRVLLQLALSAKAPVGFGQDLGNRLLRRHPITEVEEAVFLRLGRVFEALRDGRDPDVAYDMGLRFIHGG